MSDLFCAVCDRDHTTDTTLVLARWQDQDICTDCLAHHAQMEAEALTDKEPSVPDRLASRVVLAVMEILAEHDVLITAGIDENWIITDLNNATDKAIEEVERLLRQD